MKQKIRIRDYSTPCGTLLLGACEDQICLCDWAGEGTRRTGIDRRINLNLHAGYVRESSEALERLACQLDEYFAGRRRVFEDIRLLPVGTPFQQQVWSRLAEVFYGQTHTYAWLAQQVGRPKSVRAVANACGANALSILIPCHRIVGSDRCLTGYAGGLDAKRWLLELEAANSNS